LIGGIKAIRKKYQLTVLASRLSEDTNHANPAIKNYALRIVERATEQK
jgi:hypothetical protein